VHLKNLNLYNFRNIKEQKLDFDSHIVAFRGLNGQGKTNIVESIYALSKGKSFRTSDLNHLVKNDSGSEGTRIFGEIFSDDTDKALELKIIDQQKTHTMNEKKLNALKIFKNFPVILFSPESLSAIKDGPEVRRNLIDETLILENESNISVIQNFRKILKTKNHVLRQFKQGRLTLSQAKDLLMGINPVFYNHATELTELRMALLKNIHNLNQQSLIEITGKNVDIAVNYVTKFESEKAAQYDPNTLRKDLDEKVAIEMSSGTSLYGPHKHDVVFEYSGIDSRFYCSQGQQRALILAFKFSQILYHHTIYGYYPILILDDVLSEFDREKRSFLIQFLNKNEAQTFLTTTEIDEELSHLDISVLNVKDGSVSF
jgi:DNA replication and repair protein RecF